MSNTPSDEELGQLAKECGIGWGAGLGGMNDFLRAFARAVLAKWGTPQPVVREPLPASYQGSTLTSNYHEKGCRVSFSFGSVAQAEAWHESIIDQHYGITQKGGSNAE